MEVSMESAVAHFRAGRYEQATAEYREIVRAQPDNALALLHLGMLRFQERDFVEAITLLRRSIQHDAAAPGAYYTLALALSANQQIAPAIEALQKALHLRPNWPEALIGIGSLLERSGALEAAESALRRAVELKPDSVEALINLGNIQQHRGQFAGAIESYRKAIAHQPNSFDAQTNLGNALGAMGDREGELAAFQTALQLNPQSPIAMQNLGVSLLKSGRWSEAHAVYQRAVQLKPDFPEGWLGLGNALRDLHRPQEAVDAFKNAIRYRPNYVEAFHNLGNAEHAIGNKLAAVEAYRKAIALAPTFLRSYVNLGCLLQNAGKLDEAEHLLRKALSLQPDFHVTLCNLGNVVKDSGKIEEANDLFRRALQQNPADVLTHSNLAYSVYFDPRCTPQNILAENIRFNAMHAAALAPQNPSTAEVGHSGRRLRIGYFGAHFRSHCQSFFTLPLLEHHDRDSFEIFCYADENQPDAVTDRLRAAVEHWSDLSKLTDTEAADRIRNDGIDILIDLTMHMGRGRPLVMARKPAPVQAAWLAYPGTTGLSAMDYRLTDPQLDPRTGETDADYSEKSYRLPDTFWCYEPLSDQQPSSLPADASGFITFGCLNNFCKVTEQTVALWAKVLGSVENSQLLLMAGEGSHRDRLRQYFEHAGVKRDRIRFEKYRPRDQYLQSYQQIDIGLDTIPYNGHTTSLDSFWMGVPVVTRVGDTVVGRAGLSQLTNLGLTELAAFDDETFISIATSLASDRNRLRELRSTLRQRMQNSPLMDGARFARGMEKFFQFAINESRASTANSPG